MSRNLALLLFVLAIGSLACTLTSSSSTEPTAVSVQPTASVTQVAASNTATPSPTTTTASADSGSPANGGGNSCTPRTDWPTYTVVSGDTLGQIAQRTGSTIQELVSANCLNNADSISVGQALRVPRQPDPVTSPGNGGLVELNPTDRPPISGCSAVNPNAAGYINVYTDTSLSSTVNARLITWAPLVARSGDWYQITIPDSGLNYVEAMAVLAIGDSCPPESGLGPLNLKPSDAPPSDICAVRNLNPSVPVAVHTDTDVNSISGAQLITWAPYGSTAGDWYQIIIPESGLNYVQASQVELVGASCP